MKRNILIIISVFIAVIFLTVTGNVIIIGEKLAAITNLRYAEHAWYGLMGVLCLWYIVRPCLRVISAPAMPSLSLDDKKDLKAIRIFARQLAGSCGYIPQADVRTRHARDLQEAILKAGDDMDTLTGIIRKEISLRVDGDGALSVISMDRRIREWAKSVFLVTAIAHNSKFDALTMLILNHKMIEGVILSSGFRPTNAQMFRIYTWIIGTAFFSYLISDPLNSIGDIRPFSALGQDEIDTDGSLDWGDFVAGIRIPGFVAGSIADGAANTLMSLRIGYIAKAYITTGAEQLQGREQRRAIKREALRKAVLVIPAISAEVTGDLTAKAASKTWEQVKGTAEGLTQKAVQKVGGWFRQEPT